MMMMNDEWWSTWSSRQHANRQDGTTARYAVPAEYEQEYNDNNSLPDTVCFDSSLAIVSVGRYN